MDMGEQAELQNRKLQESAFPNEFTGFYFALASFLLGTQLEGVRTVEGNTLEVSFGSQLLIFFLGDY